MIPQSQIARRLDDMKTLAVTILLVSLGVHATFSQTPKTAEDYNNRGLERQGKGDIEGAIDDYTKAIALKARPNTIAIAYNNRANARMSKNDLEGAISDYSKAIEVQPDEPENFYNRGVARLTKGDNDGAIADFSRTTELSPRRKTA